MQVFKWYIYFAGYVLVANSGFGQAIGIVGGEFYFGGSNVNDSTVALVDRFGAVQPILIPPSMANPVRVFSVAMNPSSISIIGGEYAGQESFGAILDASGAVTGFQNNTTNVTFFNGVAINALNTALAVGKITGFPFGQIVDLQGQITPLTNTNACGMGQGVFNSVAINGSGQAILGGSAGGGPSGGLYIAFLPSGSNSVQHIYCQSSPSSSIASVAINESGNSIAGGFLNGNAYAALFNPTQSPVTLNLVSFPFATGGSIQSVSINDSGISLIGGIDNTNGAYAALVDASGQLQPPLSGDPLPTGGAIQSVDIVDGFGNAIIGGQDTINQTAYAAYVDVLGNVHRISGLPTGPNASISSVSLNAWGTALIGGTTDGVNGYAALVNPSGVIRVLNLGDSPGVIHGVSIRDFIPVPHLSPLGNLTGNNLIFAKYIIDNAPKKAVYFSPSFFNGTLADALESAAPTRNALNVFAAANNLFFLNTSLAFHLRRHREFERCPKTYYQEPETPCIQMNSALVAMTENEQPVEESIQPEAEKEAIFEPIYPEWTFADRPWTLWFDAIGALASQKPQDQTVGFDPVVGGFILAMEKRIEEIYQIGGGVSYLYTHIFEKEDAGFSNINQECLFLYAMWSMKHFYLDTAFWFGIFQTHQVRKIHMVGFDFEATSNPTGTFLDPHLELGYAIRQEIHHGKLLELKYDPFAMVDWVNIWQPHYEERGSSPFNASQKSHYSSLLRTEVGLRLYEVLALDSGRLTFEEKGSYVFRQPFEIGSTTAFLVGSPGLFTVETLTAQDHLGAVEVSCLYEPANPKSPSGSISYQGEFSSSYQSHQLTLEAAWDF